MEKSLKHLPNINFDLDDITDEREGYANYGNVTGIASPPAAPASPAPTTINDLDDDEWTITDDSTDDTRQTPAGLNPPGTEARGVPSLQHAGPRSPGEGVVQNDAPPSPFPTIITTPRTSPPPPTTYREIVLNADGTPRQAGADQSGKEGAFVTSFRARAEQHLYIFAKGVLGRHFLTPQLHMPVCNFIQKVPPARKLVLMPREHAKTAIVSGALPPHMHIQPAATNIYFPGLDGSECRLLMSGETETMAKKNLRVVKSIYEGNQLLRALWPERVWENARKQAGEWSSTAIILPRDNEWPDPNIRAVGVGGAITGARPNVLIKDDLVSFAAANSEVVMQEAIEWHIASRALLETYEVESGLMALEIIIGTRWAVYDLYSYIIDNDPSVEVIDPHFHRIIDDGAILWPEKHTEATIDQLRREHGSAFFLLYMNTASDSSLTDFDVDQVREFKLIDGKIIFDEDERDTFMQEKKVRVREVEGKMEAVAPDLRGMRLQDGLDILARRNEYFRMRGV